MMNVYLWLLLAIALAVVVLVVAGMVAADESDARERTAAVDRNPRAVLRRMLSDARAGARSLLSRSGERGHLRDVLDRDHDLEPSTSVDEFFEATRTEQRAYLDVDEIQEIIQGLRPRTDKR